LDNNRHGAEQKEKWSADDMELRIAFKKIGKELGCKAMMRSCLNNARE
jgi:hypothetical protein